MDCLEDEEWSIMSDKIIAQQCGCGRVLVLRVRQELNVKKPDVINFVNKKGKVKTQSVTAKTNKPESKKKEEIVENKEEKYDARDDVIHDLKAENVDLKDRLAIAAFDSTDEEKQMAEQTIKDLREQIRVLEIELVAVKTSRDTFQKENAEMKKQIFAMQKKLKAVEAK
jgi:chromosome segregation ATPase